VTNTTFARNSAETGGAIATDGVRLDLVHVTVISNSASDYGGLVGDNIYLRNSLVAYNIPDKCKVAIDSNGANRHIPGATSGAAAVANPRLLPVADNGGGSLTAALAVGSPAIDAADMGYCPATDQRGFRRPVGAGCDLGAYERWLDVHLPLVRQ